jgi:hypothetical protein
VFLKQEMGGFMNKHAHGALWYDSEERIRILEINLTHAAVASYLDSPA